MDKIIRLNDSTSHGGKVISAQSGLTAQGIAVACVGDLVECPLCKGGYPISEAPHLVKYKGKKLAVAGMQSTCGAVLIASQGSAKIK
ncbi:MULTISPECIES: PAAR domain-containing protein [unclassified Symbiopectobacterium]|uniref:PAAR domain-containing protein n=1 Tax=unclassified Symbiopectobacterium TaxID=2794573 RepID=UPI0022265FAD|nr:MULTISPECIES: PAAR domain-containing protein [unclassified Symbiopectobacterium]MCW2474219.1 PAAR domain-containing protein [Candidatus Symbiopectobacterium sp. NZEC151]MCW2485455.1 PAAR domain-containing protein [Candidatus Symbiopectobacterium sp. NZEC127]